VASVLEPGEILFVPAGSPHMVENLGTRILHFLIKEIESRDGLSTETIGV
jgi:mannose-6-phosphate isomerase-like protein (cupin superfamily)